MRASHMISLLPRAAGAAARRITVALCCALQFWVRSRQDPAAALADYIALCGRGGSAPFTGLVASAGLASPFAPGALEAVVREAEKALAA